MTTNSNEPGDHLPVDLAEDAQLEEAVNNRLNFERSIENSNMWSHSSLGLEAKKAAMTMLSTKHGMYARIPLICKADACPYAESCHLLPYGLAPQGEFCPIETAQIELRYAGYSEDFNTDTASFTDKNLISEIINLDIFLERCKALIAKEGVPVVDVVAGISESGEEFYRPEVSKYFEAYDKASRRRNELYQLMMATRRDRKNDVSQEKSINDILQDAMELDGFVVEERPAAFKEEK